MNFISLPFLAFAAVALAGFFLVPARWRWLWLLLASLFFYSFAGARAVACLVVQTGLVFVAGLALDRAGSRRARRLLLLAGLGASLAGLAAFKYAAFFAGIVSGAARRPEALAGFLGLSFYSLKLASYVLDVYWKRLPAERHPGYFALSIAFFPQLIMGPIERPAKLLPELRRRTAFDYDRLESGVTLIAWGVFKKLAVADRLAPFVARVFDRPEGQGLWLLLGAYAFAVQLYCDFSGYSDIAVGLARILGYDTSENFRLPYASRSLPEFWTRWHITFSTWLRDYLFLPIAYAVSRRLPGERWLGVKPEFWAYSVGIAATWTIGGLWHGAAWTFVAWGLLHGVFLAVSNATKRLRKRVAKATGFARVPRLRQVLQGIFTFHLVCLAWVFFRASSLPAAWKYLRLLSLNVTDAGRPLAPRVVFSLAVVALFLALEALFVRRERWPAWRRLPAPVKAAAFALFLCLTALLAVDSGNEFIYARF